MNKAVVNLIVNIRVSNYKVGKLIISKFNINVYG